MIGWNERLLACVSLFDINDQETTNTSRNKHCQASYWSGQFPPLPLTFYGVATPIKTDTFTEKLEYFRPRHMAPIVKLFALRSRVRSDLLRDGLTPLIQIY